MPQNLTVDELVIDDSFINYCLQKNDYDQQYWVSYLNDHPQSLDTIEEARQLVFMLHGSLSGLSANTELPKPVSPLRNSNWKYAAVAASLVAITTLSGLLLTRPGKTENVPADIAKNNSLVFNTKLGAKETLTLPDGTTVYLNSGSTLRLDDGFGKNNRQVYLVGEGGFDVTHNEHLPFTVSVEKYEVHVKGTFFNVKAYPGDATTETSLLRGKVDIFIKDGHNTFFRMSLKPQQKFVLNTDGDSTDIVSETDKKDAPEQANTPHVKIESLVYNHDSLNVETAWIQNTLLIEDETFEMLEAKLERWYNVSIRFKDEKVKSYKFTASFKRENIAQVLKALQASYYFNYTIDGKDITISK